MSTNRKLATALLVFVALWPLVTLWLHARYDVDPWKLMSFGMGCGILGWIAIIALALRFIH